MADANLSVLLFNVWNLPGICTDGKSRERALAISPHLNAYDVVILNEAFTNKDALLKGVVHEHQFVLKRQWFTIFDSGVIILSKYPIVRTCSEHYTMRRSYDWFAAKGLAMCTIDVNGTLVDVYGTHMQAGNSVAEAQARSSQSEQVAKAVQAWSPNTSTSGRAVIFAGDLNMGPTIDSLHYSGHYGSYQDALDRTAAYVAMRKGSELTDVFSDGPLDEKQDINRFLVRNVKAARISYAYELRKLSDSDAVICHVSL